MLALDVNLLTTKLQNQTLEEGQPTTTTTAATAAAAAANITLINHETGYKLSESAQAKLAAAGQGKALYKLAISSDGSKKDGGISVTQPSTRDGAAACGAVTKVLCSHKKPQHVCTLCDSNVCGTTQSERPKKRHCRSMSVPQETEISIPPAKSSWQPQGSGLWKPVATAHNFQHGYERKWDVRSVHWSPTDCRNYEFSSIAPPGHKHIATGHITPDDLFTPPQSPIPRPNSVYSDGAISPFTSDPYTDCTSKLYFSSEFRNRSLSVEDKISNSAAMSTGVHGITGLTGSMPSSPHHRYRIPRCRSQPSFYDRKSGRRRRRDCRPTLNFNKMTETAYGHLQKTASLAQPSPDQTHGSCFHHDMENAMSLMPIASSPRDGSDILTMRHITSNKGNSPINELEYATRDSGIVSESTPSTPGPVKLLGEEGEDENGMEVFQFTEELDLEQIENH